MIGLIATTLALLVSTLVLASTTWAQTPTQTASTDQANFLRFPPSSILCIDDDVTGYNWRNKKWVQTNFTEGSRYIIKKIEIEKYINRNYRAKNKILFCNDPKVWDISENGKKFTGSVEACYEIKSMGNEANFMDSRMCSEWWEDGKLEKISCQSHTPQLYFQPDGSFIRFPWHTDVSKPTEKKDSLVISVGSCSVIK